MKKILSVLMLCLSLAAHGESTIEIIAFRHAEKLSGDDPRLTEQGVVRAAKLAPYLATYSPTHLYSTDYARTQATIAPLSDATGLDVTSYDPRQLQALADQLRNTPGVHVVSGHSNTTPQLVAALGGDPGEGISEDYYDALYVVRICGDKVTTERLDQSRLLQQ